MCVCVVCVCVCACVCVCVCASMSNGFVVYCVFQSCIRTDDQSCCCSSTDTVKLCMHAVRRSVVSTHCVVVGSVKLRMGGSIELQLIFAIIMLSAMWRRNNCFSLLITGSNAPV